MGNNFIINKSGLSEEEIISKFSVPEQITIAEDPQNFSCKEPEFCVADGRLQGGDFEAMKAFERLTRNDQEEVSEEACAVATEIAPEPCC